MMSTPPWNLEGGFPLLSLRGEIDRLFDGFLQDGMMAGFGGKAFRPTADLRETDEAVVVEVELPGMKPEDVKVTVEEGVLAVTAERKQEKDEKTKAFHRSERYYGRMERRFALPSSVEAGNVEAEVKDGVLTVTLPKKAGAKAKSVAVKAK